ncbi:MAG: hypothetical protein WAX04_11635 [Oscillospiraceae bacterium]
MEQNSNYINYEPQQQPIQQQPPMRPPIMPQIRRTKNKFFTFVTALVPGAGQMYHGLIKKGLSIMGVFWGVIAVSVLLYIPVICFALPIIWFYSFFDAVNRMNMPIDEMKMIKDEFIYNIDMPKNKIITQMIGKRHLWIGWGLTIIGIYSIFRMSLERCYEYIRYYFSQDAYWAIRNIINAIPTLIVPVVCVVIGIRLIKVTNKKQNSEIDEIINIKSE